MKTRRKMMTENKTIQATEIGADPISVAIEHNELVLRMPLHEPVPSKSGKTMVVASTMGALPTYLSIEGSRLIVNANAYIKLGEPEWRQATQATMARLLGRLK
jgi:hypothetical protein